MDVVTSEWECLWGEVKRKGSWLVKNKAWTVSLAHQITNVHANWHAGVLQTYRGWLFWMNSIWDGAVFVFCWSEVDSVCVLLSSNELLSFCVTDPVMQTDFPRTNLVPVTWEFSLIVWVLPFVGWRSFKLLYYNANPEALNECRFVIMLWLVLLSVLAIHNLQLLWLRHRFLRRKLSWVERKNGEKLRLEVGRWGIRNVLFFPLLQ